MSRFDCTREEEIVAVVLSGRWPHAADEELAAHVEHCDICRDVVTVAGVLHAEHQRDRVQVHVPAAGQVWWRAAVRARLEAVQAAQEPITWVQGLAGAMAVGVLVALIGVVWPTLTGFAGWVTTRAAMIDPAAADVAGLITATLQRSLPLAIAAAACIAIAPIALYFALTED